MVALLTTDNHVHFFDYKTLMLIAKTKELVKDNVIFDIFLHSTTHSTQSSVDILTHSN